MSKNIIRKKLTVTGQVQGVGFRPFIYRTALENNITGSVKNSPEGVIIEIQGTDAQLSSFRDSLDNDLPRLARIITLKVDESTPQTKEKEFQILASTSGEGHSVLISPDVATCPDCFADMNDPANRRYNYPFTNCTNCGPRYTITRSIPYDRPVTSMSCFPMCEDCMHEYTDPLDRRFHAQPNACPDCGPKVWLTDKEGNTIAEENQALEMLAAKLAEGQIAAIKGLGGFHLACDASSSTAVSALRERKNRPEKPLAVMVMDPDHAAMLAAVSETDRKILEGLERPIVLLPKSENFNLAPEVAPDTELIGIMVPYTPLHHVLMKFYSKLKTEPASLIMTSGNMSSDPISLGNREAFSRLNGIADVFLFHNRDILIRVDDSVVTTIPEFDKTKTEKKRIMFMRRARGFVPSPVFLTAGGPSVIGTGPELKNTLCITKDDQAFVSQHIGDMQNLETLEFWKEIRNHLTGILKVSPELIIRDLHPDYMTTNAAIDDELPSIALQHHFAHIHSVLAENMHTGPAVGIALDGTGFGEDNTIWGGEFLYVNPDTLDQQRLAHFSNIRLPGGEAAVREPWRIAQGIITDLNLAAETMKLDADLEKNALFLKQMLSKNINCPATSSCGRLFDAVSAMCGLCSKISYEGQAAIILEKIQDQSEKQYYECRLIKSAEMFELDTTSMLKLISEDIRQKISPAIISRKFHLGLIKGVAEAAHFLCEKMNVNTVGLSGGVMQNRTIAIELPRELYRYGLNVLVHRQLPPNDGCISLGQAVYGQRMKQLGKI
jgi:hydrogenase maturation protein HypF